MAPHNTNDYQLAESSNIGCTKLYAGFHPPKPFRLSSWRWVALVLMNLALVGYLAVFDSPQPLERAIKSKFHIGDTQYSLLYSFLALPSIVMPLVAGYLVDVIGVRPSMIIFGSLVLFGQVLFAFGADILQFNLMIVGRFVYSLGADPLNIAQVVMVNHWFKHKELALAISLGTLMAGGGKAFNSAVIPAVYASSHENLASPLYLGGLVCLASLACVFLMVILDKKNERREKLYDPNFTAAGASGEKVDIRAIFKFKPIVWLLVFNYGILDGVIFTFRSFLNEFYMTLYGYSSQFAGNIISSHYVTMAIFCPLVGRFIDKYGKRSSTLFYISFLAIISFLIFIMVPSCDKCFIPAIPMVILGICVAFDDAAVFCSLPLVLEEKYLGTGYGLYYSLQNILLTILPPITGEIISAFKDPKDGYYWTIVFLLGLSLVATAEAYALYAVDRKNGGVLDQVDTASDDIKEESPSETPRQYTRSERGPDDSVL